MQHRERFTKILPATQRNIAWAATKLQDLGFKHPGLSIWVQFKGSKELMEFPPQIIIGDFNNEEQSTAMQHYEEITSISFNNNDYHKLSDIEDITITNQLKN